MSIDTEDIQFLAGPVLSATVCVILPRLLCHLVVIQRREKPLPIPKRGQGDRVKAQRTI